MRWTDLAAAGAALGAAALMTACGASTAAQVTAARPGSADQCYAFAVAALRSHVVVRTRPAACAGLNQAQVNQIVGRAIRTVVGPHPKAIERRLALGESRYLGSLVKPVRAPAATSLSAGQPTTTGQLTVRLSALAAWTATTIPGGYLLAGWLTRDGRRRRIRKPGTALAVPIAHAGLAITGLLIWIAFVVLHTAALAWADVGLTWVIAGLGMATLLAASTEEQPVVTADAAVGGPGATSTTPFPTRAPVVTIALHGTLATLTILLVLLAAVGIG